MQYFTCFQACQLPTSKYSRPQFSPPAHPSLGIRSCPFPFRGGTVITVVLTLLQLNQSNLFIKLTLISNPTSLLLYLPPDSTTSASLAVSILFHQLHPLPVWYKLYVHVHLTCHVIQPTFSGPLTLSMAWYNLHHSSTQLVYELVHTTLSIYIVHTLHCLFSPYSQDSRSVHVKPSWIGPSPN